ncbi:MAG: T9SS type A sorting domain-containing protein [Saprospiraceae bacterium]
MKIFLYCILLFVFSEIHAQDTTIFAPSGSAFYYTAWGSGAPYPGLLTFVSDGEIVLNDTSARILNFYRTEGNVLVPEPGLNKYVFTSGNKVYYWVQDGFYLLYDFGAQPGDTIHSRVEDFSLILICFADFSNGPFDFSYVIDSVSTMHVDGQDLRVQYVTPIYTPGEELWYLENPIIERIGQIASACYWWGRGEGCFLGGFAGQLRCYEDEDIYFKNTFTLYDLDCDYVAEVEAIVQDTNSIFPNPATDIIYLPQSVSLLTIYNLTGQKITSFENQDQIDVSNLSSGIYFLQYQSGKFLHLEKLIKL